MENIALSKHRLKEIPLWKKKLSIALKKHWQLYLLTLPVLLYFIIFEYLPMYGVVIAFKNFNPVKGIMD
ncbi:MAG: sugar ABC transporter permease, partial [Clostridiaceae bacterium]|nr:sugar ABC transporter permease [Clostridiaceae bacterium]